MINIASELKEIQTIAIAGHIKPDGDCVGSCLGLYHYIKDNFPDKEAAVFLDPFHEALYFLNGSDSIKTAEGEDRSYDLFFAMDSGDEKRLGNAGKMYCNAKKTICIDHHISNAEYAMENVVEPEASSTCEVLYGLLEPDLISKNCAEAIYTGIVHDTGVFQYSNCSPKTMRIAAALMEKGIDFAGIIKKTFYEKTYIQNQILGRALLESMLFLNGRCIVSVLHHKDMEFYGVTSKDLEGIVSQLKLTKGVEVSLFLHEVKNQEYKVSMRSGDIVDVSVIALYFGGGGHKKAAGCTMQGSMYDVINNIAKHIEKQLQENEASV